MESIKNNQNDFPPRSDGCIVSTLWTSLASFVIKLLGSLSLILWTTTDNFNIIMIQNDLKCRSLFLTFLSRPPVGMFNGRSTCLSNIPIIKLHMPSLSLPF